MTFKLPEYPSPRATIPELADFAELLAWKKGFASERYILSLLQQRDDNSINDGVNDDEEITSNRLEDVMVEIDRRSAACNGGYPFQLGPKGTVLEYKKNSKSRMKSTIYRYLLLSTRLNMQSNRTHGEIDGTALLEELSAHVLKVYLGEHSNSLVFGSSVSGRFEDKVEGLCKSLNEGGRFRNIDGNRNVDAVDDKLDTVAWVPFHDKSPAQLILFSQCKTGSNWRRELTQLQPETFGSRWMEKPFMVSPVRVLCLSESLDRGEWNSISLSGGILFDRCRIVGFSSGCKISGIKKWVDCAFESLQL